MNVTGKITKKVTKEGATAGKAWKRCSYTVGNIAYSTFDITLMDFSENDSVNIEYEKEGDFHNIRNMALEGESKGSEEVAASAVLTGKGKKFIVTVEELKE